MATSEVFKPKENSTTQTTNPQVYIRLDAWATRLGNTETSTIRVYNSVQLHNKDNWDDYYVNPGAKVQSEIKKDSSSTPTTEKWDASNLNLKAWTTVSRSYLDLTMSKDGKVTFQVSAQSIEGTTGTPTFGAFNLDWYEVTLTDLGKAQHTVAFNLGYSGAPSMNSNTKVYGTAFNMPANPTRSGYNFTGWTSDREGDTAIYKRENSSSGTNDGGYTWDQFGGTITLTAHWEPVGPTIELDNNTYFKTAHDPSSGLKFPGSLASWTTGTDGTDIYINTGNGRYITSAATYTPYHEGDGNTVGLDRSLRWAPYYRPDNIQLIGYYTGDNWNTPGVKVYELTDYMQQSNRTHVLKGVAGNNYFADHDSSITLTDIGGENGLYNKIYSINEYEATTITGVNNDSVNVYLPIAGEHQTMMSMPRWIKTENESITLYALWSKSNLTFTYDANGGTAPNNDQNIQIIANPQTTKTLNIKSLAESGITPPTGYKFIQWNTKNDNTGFSFNETGSIPLGGYLLNTTLYAIYEQYQHRVILHANSYIDGDDGPAFFPQLNGAKITNNQLYLGGNSDTNINYRGQPIHPNGLKFLGYYTVDGVEVYRVNKNLQHECTYNEVTYILNPAKAVSGDYFRDLVENIGLPTLGITEYTQIDDTKTSDLQGYKWAYTGDESTDLHLYAKWGSKSNVYFISNGVFPEGANGYIWFKNDNNENFDIEGIAEFLEE